MYSEGITSAQSIKAPDEGAARAAALNAALVTAPVNSFNTGIIWLILLNMHYALNFTFNKHFYLVSNFHKFKSAPDVPALANFHAQRQLPTNEQFNLPLVFNFAKIMALAKHFVN